MTHHPHAAAMLARAGEAQSVDDAYIANVSAVASDPDYADAWMALGHRTGEATLLAASAACYRRVIENPGVSDIERAKALCNLGLRLFHLGRIEESEAAVREALAIAPRMGFAWTNLSMIATMHGEHDAAVEYARKGWEFVPETVTELGYAFALLFAGRFVEGLRHFESRFPYRLSQYLRLPYPRWEGDRVETLLVVDEQGLGDTLSFARFIPLAAERVGRVVFAVQPELVRLLSAMLPGVMVIPNPKDFVAADAWCPTMGLPVALGLTDAAFRGCPGLPVPRMAPPLGWDLPGRRFRVGVVWAGSSSNDIDRWRSIPVTQFLELYRVPGVELYSLFVGERAADVHTAGAAGLIRDLSPWLRDAASTAAIVREMDLIITAETFLGHLAGALGVECWVLASYHGWDWRIGRKGDGSIWYPRHRVFRQSRAADWAPVWDAVVAALGERVASHGRCAA